MLSSLNISAENNRINQSTSVCSLVHWGNKFPINSPTFNWFGTQTAITRTYMCFQVFRWYPLHLIQWRQWDKGKTWGEENNLFMWHLIRNPKHRQMTVKQINQQNLTERSRLCAKVSFMSPVISTIDFPLFGFGHNSAAVQNSMNQKDLDLKVKSWNFWAFHQSVGISDKKKKKKRVLPEEAPLGSLKIEIKSCNIVNMSKQQAQWPKYTT